MELRVLAVGDVVGEGGLQCLEQHLRSQIGRASCRERV